MWLFSRAQNNNHSPPPYSVARRHRQHYFLPMTDIAT